MEPLVFVRPPDDIRYEGRLLPSVGLFYLLPMITAPHRFPGLGPWVISVAEKLSPEFRADCALLTAIVYRSLTHFELREEQLESAEALFSFLENMPGATLQTCVMKGIPGISAEQAQALLTQPDELRAVLEANPYPSAEEPLPVDVDRLARLILHPEELQALLLSSLRRLWEEHLGPFWEHALPALRQNVTAIRRHFSLGTPARVFQAVTGRPVPESLGDDLDRMKRVLFCPHPFLGPYLAYVRIRGEEMVRVSYGVGIQPASADDGEETLPGGLLPALEALADETRLLILARIRDRGQGCAQDFMNELGLSQPATSRHLKLLETTGILSVERIEGIKWYRINPTRANRVAESVKRFLSSDA